MTLVAAAATGAEGITIAVTVMVEPFIQRTVVPLAPVLLGMRYRTIEVPAATVTESLNVPPDDDAVTAVPNVATVPPLLEY